MPAEHPVAEDSGRLRVDHRARQALGGELGLAVDVENHVRGARGVRGEQHAFQDPVRIGFHQMAVLDDAGLAFFAVHDEILRLARRVPTAFPLHRGGKEGAAASLKPGTLDLGDDGLRRGVERARERAIRPV